MPILDKADENYLKPWLIKALEPICDADPEVLGDYVLALLKHDEPEAQLRTGLERQLNEFLEAEAPTFVDKLFRAIRSKAYMPYDDAKPEPAAPSSLDGIHIPIDALVTRSPRESRGIKRGAENDSFSPRQPPKGPRLSREHAGRGSNGRGPPPSGFRNADSRGGRGGRPNKNAPSTSRGGRPKEPCRDYHTLGYCPRGEMCPHAHGEEAIVPPMPFGAPGPNGMGLNPLQMMTMMQSGFPMAWMMDPSMSGAYNPNDARMDMSGAPFALDSGPRNNKKHQPSDAIDLSDLSAQPSQPAQGVDGTQQNSPPPPTDVSPPLPSPQNGVGPNAGTHINGNTGPTSSSRGRGGRGRNGHHGVPPVPGTFPNADQQPHFGDDAASSRGGSRQDGNRTIVVEKIPQESLSLPAVSEWFTRFGNVTNVAIDTPTAKALVSFATPQEARAAWGSQEAVFGNRFVKVFWHRPLAGHGEAGTKKLAASAPLVQNMLGVEKTGTATTSTSSSIPPTTEATSTSQSTSSASPAMTPSESIAARKELLEKQIAEQKALFASLESASSPKEKKEIMAKLRSLGEEMKKSQTNTASTNLRKILPSPEEKERLVREKLDRELEIHTISGSPGATAPDNATVVAGDGSRKDELLAELAELRKQAAEVGVSSAEIAGVTPSYRGRGFQRGRGRGRGSYGRGWGFAPAPRSLKLDNRPRGLVARGINTDDEGTVSGIEEFYKSLGPMESLQVSGPDEVHVQFQTRAVAEQAMSKGAPPGSSSVSWHNALQQSPTTLATSSEAIAGGSPTVSSPVLPDSGGHDEPDNSYHASTTLSDPKDNAPQSSLISDAVSVRSTHAGSSVKPHAPHEYDDSGWGAGGGFDD